MNLNCFCCAYYDAGHGYNAVCNQLVTPCILLTYCCSDIDECLPASPCHVDAICIDNEGGYMCLCKSGYHGNGTQCQGQSAICNEYRGVGTVKLFVMWTLKIYAHCANFQRPILLAALYMWLIEACHCHALRSVFIFSG